MRSKRLNSSSKTPSLKPKSHFTPKKIHSPQRPLALSTFIHRVLKKVHPDLKISSKSMEVLNSMMLDLLKRMTEEAALISKRNGKKTLTAWDIRFAIKLTFP
mmetsp:Transcript_19182/g.13878  ORF Transcript_19182/g.13878 Transcript_19182/m.13878 type:complete len:102 (+) Transcript_19182:36-341(+)